MSASRASGATAMTAGWTGGSGSPRRCGHLAYPAPWSLSRSWRDLRLAWESSAARYVVMPLTMRRNQVRSRATARGKSSIRTTTTNGPRPPR